jgi:hypothetical protein
MKDHLRRYRPVESMKSGAASSRPESPDARSGWPSRGTWPVLRLRPVSGTTQGLLRRRSGTNHMTATAANRA